MAIKYFGLYGLTEKKPSGLVRRTKDKRGLWYEYLDARGEWVGDPNLVRHFWGYSDEAEEITEAEALKFIAKSRSP